MGWTWDKVLGMDSVESIDFSSLSTVTNRNLKSLEEKGFVFFEAVRVPVDKSKRGLDGKIGWGGSNSYFIRGEDINGDPVVYCRREAPNSAGWTHVSTVEGNIELGDLLKRKLKSSKTSKGAWAKYSE